MILITIDGYDSLYKVFAIRNSAPVRLSNWKTIESDLSFPLLFKAYAMITSTAPIQPMISMNIFKPVT